jgi:hypothetical protein
VPSRATASLDAAGQRALQRFVGLLRKRFAEDLYAVRLYGPRVHGELQQGECELQLLVLLRHSSRSDRVTALELLWQAALAERASESYLSIRISDRASPERRRALDEFMAREIEPDGIALFARSGPAPVTEPAARPRAGRLTSPESRSRRSACQRLAGRAFSLHPLCWFGAPQRARRWCVDALVTFVPADAIPRRRRPAHDLLYDARARRPLGRLGVDLNPISGLQLDALTS